jgi:hypothetical protein
MHDFELQTDQVPKISKRNQTPIKEVIENNMQTDEIKKDIFSMHTQTEQTRKIF